ncbi:type VI secretion protein VasK, partial [Pseudomonas fulva]|nr:type VI secretion protein VasK [Pseudomonas fulva]MBF8699493.1 type VI secretion protein VasK [Pseudomonas fulva]
MDKKRVGWFGLICALVFIAFLVLCGLLFIGFGGGGRFFGSGRIEELPWLIVFAGVFILIVVGGGRIAIRRIGGLAYAQLVAGKDSFAWSDTSEFIHHDDDKAENTPQVCWHLQQRYGWFWRRKVYLLLVVGEPIQVEAIAPGLVDGHWLEGRDTVLLYGGSIATALDTRLLDKWQRQFGCRGIEGIVWALRDRQADDRSSMSTCIRQLQDIGRFFGRALPLHLWQVCDSGWDQSERDVTAVGCTLPAQRSGVRWDEHVGDLQFRLREQGLVQMHNRVIHDFLLRLARDLQGGGAARWCSVLESLSDRTARGVQLRGLWFSLPVHSSGSVPAIDHHWPEDPAWSGILSDRSA